MEKSTRKRSGFTTALKVAGIVIGVTVLIHVVSALTFDRIIEYKEVPFSSPQVPQDMDGYRIAFISDTHAMTEQELNQVVQELNTQQLDLLILGGDYYPTSAGTRRLMQILSMVQTTDGIYGVEGNHDHRDRTGVFSAMEQYGIRPLNNSGVYIREGFFLAGVKDYWTPGSSIPEAMQGSQKDDFVLLVSHNPDITMVQDTTAVDLVLSGHTHGGHVTLFGLWAPALTMTDIITDYGQRFMSGWAKSRDDTPVYVSNGTGPYSKVPRVFARPQVIIITLHST